jgi:hypothetical protein
MNENLILETLFGFAAIFLIQNLQAYIPFIVDLM